MVDDSQSEGSVLTEMDEGDDEEDAGSLGDEQAVSGANGSAADAASEGPTNGTRPTKKSRKPKSKAGKKEAGEQTDEATDQAGLFQVTADTEAMMKGMSLSDAGGGAIQFGEMDEPVQIPSRAQAGAANRPLDRQKREHQEYRQKRSADPAFIPSRGNFFMPTLVGLRMAKDLLRIGARRLVGVGGELCWVRRPARLPIPPSDQRKRLKCPGSMTYMKSSTRNLKLPHRTRSRPHNSIGMTRLVSLHDLFCPHKHPDKLNRPRSPSIVLFLWRRDKLAYSSRV